MQRMKIHVKIIDSLITIPCHNPENTISWLLNETLRRFQNLKPIVFEKEIWNESSLEVRNTENNALLDHMDSIGAVLSDGDTVCVDKGEDTVIDLEAYRRRRGSIPVFTLPTAGSADKQVFVLDGNSLQPETLVRISKGNCVLQLTEDAWFRVGKSRQLVEDIVAQNKVSYGINTGFGKFASVVINEENLEKLQLNLIRSHAAGVGTSLSLERIRMLLALRINVLAKGYSGISKDTLTKYIAAFNANCLPWVPQRGTVGASGDLAPLSHLALGFLGEGKMWSNKTGWMDAHSVMKQNNLEPLHLKAKEGIALINGTQLITALTCEALVRAEAIAKQADVITALSLEANKGTSRAFDSIVSAVRPHAGQGEVATRLRALLHNDMFPSAISQSHRFCTKVQDAYTLRCSPQVHGVVIDTLKFVRQILTVECNSATDNPLVFAEEGEVISAGNFHGEYPAKAADYLAIAVHELANISERRTERLVNPHYSELPAFLTKNGGLNSGFMMAHVTAASLVSENKVLCHPASVDSLTTSAGQEDHVSMGGFSARKALQVVSNVEYVLAIELLAACQAIDFLRPLKTTAPLELVYQLVRLNVPTWEEDRFMSPDIEHVALLLRDEQIWKTVKPFIEKYMRGNVCEKRSYSPTASVSLTDSPCSSRHVCNNDSESVLLPLD